MASIKKMKAAQRINNIAGIINGIGAHQGTGPGKTGTNPMKPKRTNVMGSGRRRGLGNPFP